MANDENEEKDYAGQPDTPAFNISNGSTSQLETLVQAASEEYQNIDHTLDEIDSWMTKLEEQNDNLFSELEQLLESNRQARKELQEQQKQDVTDKQQNPKEPMEQDGS